MAEPSYLRKDDNAPPQRGPAYHHTAEYLEFSSEQLLEPGTSRRFVVSLHLKEFPEELVSVNPGAKMRLDWFTLKIHFVGGEPVSVHIDEVNVHSLGSLALNK